MGRISPKSFENQVLARNGRLGQDAEMIMASALNAVDPYTCVTSHLGRDELTIEINGERIALEDIDRVYLVAIGKAAVPMAMAALDIFGDLIVKAMAVTKDPRFLEKNGYQGKLEVFLGGHPVPTTDSVKATREVLDKIPQLTARDLVITAISGGGSALFTAPVAGLLLDDLQVVTSLLLRSGADIQEINTIRKHLDQVKGGRLAKRWSPARIQTLILSDVIGDQLDMIASGPTVADPTTYTDAWAILEKHHLVDAVPASIREVLEQGKAGLLDETIKPDDFRRMNVSNHLVGTNQLAALAAKAQAETLGYVSEVVTTVLTGTTDRVAKVLQALIDQWVHERQQKPGCLIFGGETTVNVTGTGKGGRSQDLVMRMVPYLAIQKGVLFISLATDGDDGPTDAAGGAADSLVLGEGYEEMGLEIGDFIANNDAYPYLKQTGCLMLTGATGTNVNDLIFVFIG